VVEAHGLALLTGVAVMVVGARGGGIAVTAVHFAFVILQIAAALRGSGRTA
jgi:hypothetical protein